MHALVTGASGALGEALATSLAARGHALTLASRRTAPMHALAARLDVPTQVLAADLAEADQALGLLDRATAGLGPVDVLVNNAGMQYVEPGASVGPARIARIVALNVTTPLQLMHGALADMLARGQGTVINICSMAGITPTPGMAHYSATKAGLAAASETLRVELAGSGVHVLTVYPGPIDSEMERAARARLQPGWGSRLAPSGTPEGLAQAVLRACDRRRARVIYPAPYRVGRVLRVTSQWLVDRLTPPLVAAADAA